MQAENSELLSGPTSDDLTPSHITPTQTRAVPGGKRERIFQRNLAKVREAVVAGEFNPTSREIRRLCQCGAKSAESIRSALVREGICVVDGRGRVTRAA